MSRLRTHPDRVTITGPRGRPQTITITLPGFLSADRKTTCACVRRLSFMTEP